eukprot:3104795-Rhodomonas_salina.1
MLLVPTVQGQEAAMSAVRSLHAAQVQLPFLSLGAHARVQVTDLRSRCCCVTLARLVQCAHIGWSVHTSDGVRSIGCSATCATPRVELDTLDTALRSGVLQVEAFEAQEDQLQQRIASLTDALAARDAELAEGRGLGAVDEVNNGDVLDGAV